MTELKSDAPQTGPTAGDLPDWEDYLGAIGAAGQRIIDETANPESALERQESWRTLMATLAEGFVTHTASDPNYPEFVPYLSMAFNIGAPVPDFMYLNTELDGAGTYRFRGFRGTNLYTDVMASPGIWALGTAGSAVGHWTLDDDCTIASDGSFDVLLSAERPAGHTGDWWHLDPNATRMTIRNVSYDWVNERDSLVTIERLDVPARRSRASAQELSTGLSDLATWTEKGAGAFWSHLKRRREAGVVNQVSLFDWGSAGGLAGQIFLEGLFDLHDDEALILETDVPGVTRYWSFLVGDNQFTTIDWMNHQSSINGFQAVLDSDGKFRAVVALQDPGVPNWLDTGGHSQGFIQVRWNGADSAPVPVARVVKLSELRSSLPADTPSVSSAERDRVLRDRRFGAQLRRRW